MANHYMQNAKAERTRELSIKNIMAKLKAGSYTNASHENAERKMLEHYLNGGS